MKRAMSPGRIRLAVLILILAFVLPNAAQASLLCRSDPVVILSNGMVLDIGASISSLPMQVREVHYELHVPAGVSLVTAIHTPAWLTSQETFTVIADQQPKQYQVVTTVYTSVGNATVVADTVLVSALKLRLGQFSVSGLEGQALRVMFNG
jgi:hypothetical protein